jgi:hypothetical protein
MTVITVTVVKKMTTNGTVKIAVLHLLSSIGIKDIVLMIVELRVGKNVLVGN